MNHNAEKKKKDVTRGIALVAGHVMTMRSAPARGATYRSRLLALLLGMLCSCAVPAWPEQIGSPSPRFDLADASGKKVKLEDFAGKVLLLNFWAPWCASCRIELPLLESLHRKHREAGLRVVGIAEDSSEEGTMRAAGKAGLSYLMLIDKGGKVADSFRVSGLPTTFIIDRAGIIRYRHVGFADDFKSLYERETAELLKQ